jgi:hypothetical protein
MLDKWVGAKGEAYSDFVWRAATDSKVFARFRRNRAYTRILEHVSSDLGEQYLSRISEPVLREICLNSDIADKIGSPRTARYEGREISPSTPRYGKVANDLARLFPDFCSLQTICEIGVGFGGQARILCEYTARIGGSLSRYDLVDLPEVLMLSRRYLEHFHFSNEFVYRSKTEIGTSGGGFDLAISNYAFSEFEKPLQEEYLKKILLKSGRGYLTMNSGLRDPNEPSDGDRDNYSQRELLDILPNAKVIAEEPLTAKNNYIVVFGDHSA